MERIKKTFTRNFSVTQEFLDELVELAKMLGGTSQAAAIRYSVHQTILKMKKEAS